MFLHLWKMVLLAFTLCAFWWLRQRLMMIAITLVSGTCAILGRARIYRRADGEPYMIRYAISGWLSGDGPRKHWLPNIYLHEILAADHDEHLHSHPWKWAVSLILRGSYLEERAMLATAPAHAASSRHDWRTPVKMLAYCAGMRNWLRHGKDLHRIAFIAEPGNVWTLFITGRAVSDWGFLVPGVGLVPHAEYEHMRALNTFVKVIAKRGIECGEFVSTATCDTPNIQHMPSHMRDTSPATDVLRSRQPSPYSE